MSKYKDIKEYYEANISSNYKIDKALYDRIHKFRLGWMQKSEEYMEFLGGTTIGVQPIRFSSRDEDILFTEVFLMDLDKLKHEIKYVSGINHKWNVTGNPAYLTPVYLMHRFLVSSLSDTLKTEAIKELYYIFAYKTIGSLISHYWKFQTTEAIAKATYEKLNNKYLIKRFDSWQEVFEFRSLDLLPNGLHFERLKKLDTEGIVRIVSDLQSRIRELVKNIYVIMKDIIDHNEKIVSTTMVETNDESADSVKDITERPDKYIKYIRDIINLDDFINDDIIYLVSQFSPTLDKEMLKKTLVYISKNIRVKPNTKHDFVGLSIIKTVNYLQTKGIYGDYNNHVSSILKYMRGYWVSSSVKDKDNVVIKKYLNDVVKKATNRKTSWMLVSTTTGVLLYIFVRALYNK